MSTSKILQALSDDPKLERQIGCMTGILQIFERQQVFPAKRLRHKRIGAPATPMPSSPRCHPSSPKMVHPMPNEGFNNSGDQIPQRSFLSSKDFSRVSAVDERDLPEPAFPAYKMKSKSMDEAEGVLRSPISVPELKKLAMESPKRASPDQRQKTSQPKSSVDIRDVVRSSFNKEQRFFYEEELECPAMAKDSSPRLRSKDRKDHSDPFGSSKKNEDSRRSIDFTRQGSVRDGPRFSYDGKGSSAFEYKDSLRGSQRNRDPPRFSLDSREPIRQKNEALQRSKSTSNANAAIAAPAEIKIRPPNVVARLMGLEDLPGKSCPTTPTSAIARPPSKEAKILQGLLQYTPLQDSKPRSDAKSGEAELLQPKSNAGSNSKENGSPFHFRTAAYGWKFEEPTSKSLPSRYTEAMPAKNSSQNSNQDSIATAPKLEPSIKQQKSDQELEAFKLILEKFRSKGLAEAKSKILQPESPVFRGKNDEKVVPEPLWNLLIDAAKQEPRAPNDSGGTGAHIVVIKPIKKLGRSKSCSPAGGSSPTRDIHSKNSSPNRPFTPSRSAKVEIINNTSKCIEVIMHTGASRSSAQATPRSDHSSPQPSHKIGKEVRSKSSPASSRNNPTKQNQIKQSLRNGLKGVENAKRKPARGLPKEKNDLKDDCSKNAAAGHVEHDIEFLCNNLAEEIAASEAQSDADFGSSDFSDSGRFDLSTASLDCEGRDYNEAKLFIKTCSRDACPMEQNDSHSKSLACEADTRISQVDSSAEKKSSAAELASQAQVKSQDMQNAQQADLSKDAYFSEHSGDLPEQPSPVSVLDKVFLDDFSPRSGNNSSNLSELELGSCALEKENGWESLPTLNVHETSQKNVRRELDFSAIEAIEQENKVRQVEKPLLPAHKQNELEYVRSILAASDLITESGMVLDDCKAPLNAKLFYKLEDARKQQSNNESLELRVKNQELSHRRLIFDSVNDIVTKQLQQYQEPWRNYVKLEKPAFEQQVWEELEDLPCAPSEDIGEMLYSILEKDLARKPNEWINFRKETSEISLHVERMIFKQLIEESLRDLVVLDRRLIKRS